MKDFLMNNFIYFAITVGFIILIIIGYMIDKTKTNKIKKEYEEKKKNEQLNIPITNATVTNTGINTQLNNNISTENNTNEEE